MKDTRLVFFVAWLMVLAACGGDDVAPSEDADTNGDNVRVEQPGPTDDDTDDGPCTGCFDDDTCRSGDTGAACGADGAMCVACVGDEACIDGACTTPMTGACSPDNCDGCCAGGQCQTGGADDACGVGGGACEACGADSQCNAGVCETNTANNNTMPDACGPANCAGCCDELGACVGGTADAACGTGGGQCNDCATTGAACNAGTCEQTMQPTCAMTCAGCCVGEMCVNTTDETQCGTGGAACVACGADEMCSVGACVANPPPADRWQIVMVSASIPPTKLNGSSWDLFGGDPDVVTGIAAEDIALGEYTEGFTSVKVDDFSPLWNEVVIDNVTSEALADGVYFWLFDDEAAPDDICLQIEPVDVTTINPGTNIVTICDNDAWVDWTWRVERYVP